MLLVGSSRQWSCSVSKRLVSQVAILTGTARGLGVALVERFASDGAALLLADVNGDGLPAVAAKAREGRAPDVAWIGQDLSQEGRAAATRERAPERLGRAGRRVQNTRRRVTPCF